MAKLPTKPLKIGPAELNWIFISGDGRLNELAEPPKHEFSATARMPIEAAKPVMDAIMTFWQEYAGKKAKPKSLGFKYEENDEGERTGYVLFSAKSNAFFTQKDGSEKKNVIRIFRANGQEITKQFHDAEKKAANGSEGILHVTAAIYDRSAAVRGVTLYLNAVQFTKFVEYAGSVEVEAVGEDIDDGLDTDDGLDVAPVDGPNI